MSSLVLYCAPGACSRVPLIALEEIGQPYEVNLVRFMKGEHRTPHYLSVNPKGKVPLLVADGVPLSENAAILVYLAHAYPQAKLLPLNQGAMRDAKNLSLLAWCSSGIHPIITRIRLPQMFCDVKEGQARVREMAIEAMAPNFALIEETLSRQPWMLKEWSLIDAYVYWIWLRSIGSGFDGAPYPHFADHAKRMEERPCVQRALEREAQDESQLADEGASFMPSDIATRGNAHH
jgi:glutathione S-transferase